MNSIFPDQRPGRILQSSEHFDPIIFDSNSNSKKTLYNISVQSSATENGHCAKQTSFAKTPNRECREAVN
jgi:hypothetical protein